MVRTREEGGDLIFEVADNGGGMDQEVKAKIFTTFFTTKGGKGTGLGLLTTRKIVQEHGGRIEMESAPDRGSVFRIRLPRQRLEALAAAGAAEQIGRGGETMNGETQKYVLVVDDEPDVRAYLRSALEDAGFLVRDGLRRPGSAGTGPARSAGSDLAGSGDAQAFGREVVPGAAKGQDSSPESRC